MELKDWCLNRFCKKYKLYYILTSKFGYNDNNFFYILDCHNESIFHLLWQLKTESLFFSVSEEGIHKLYFALVCPFRSIHVGVHFPNFRIIPIHFRRCEIHCLVTFNESANIVCVWHESSSSNISNSLSSNYFVGLSWYLSLVS